ncbi:hypothetical protein N657DRAFT_329597 [Parathielavia appendiculata]|uniref:Uncharacterized protein n=1 Tax=Parathielavia appendiculata TaxID=2587402 RepID=A0AAN6TQB2_9PEZI|nr:hypothetical protein N657DRAFT_329597 [Parathielavia appendiculata]
MSTYYHFNAHQQLPTPATAAAVSHSHHGGRNRRAPKLSVAQNPQKQFRGVRSMKELTETANLAAFRMRFEAVRSFDLEDDMEFCPGLLTESDLVSIHSSSSERSSLASNSPQSSPTQQPTQVASGFSLHSSSPAFIPPTYHSQQSTLKIHQPSATRARNAIPIINPATGISMSSPPPSVSPPRMQQPVGRRW